MMKKVLSFIIEHLTDKSFFLVGLSTEIKGSVKPSGSPKETKGTPFTLSFDWSQCTFGYLVQMAMRNVCINEQSKMRKHSSYFPKENAVINITPSARVAREVTADNTMTHVDKMSADEQVKLLEMLENKLK